MIRIKITRSHNHCRSACFLGCRHEIAVAACCSLIGASLNNDTLELKCKSSVSIELAMLHEGCTSLHLAVSVVRRAGAVTHSMMLLAVSRVQLLKEAVESTLHFQLLSQDFLQLL